MSVLTTFPRRAEWEKAKAILDALSIPHRVVSPDPAYSRVGVHALALGPEERIQLLDGAGEGLVVSGWVDHRPARTGVPADEPPRFGEDVFGEAAVMVLAPCVADAARIRIIAHLSGSLAEVFPYLNAELRQGDYAPGGPTFTFSDGPRMISLYPRSIAVAKAEGIVDAWRVLEMVRRLVNDVWARRGGIEPCHEMRHRPPVLEVFKHLPQTNCRACGEMTCLAFATKLHAGGIRISRCLPVFGGEFLHLRDSLLQIGMRLGNSFSADEWAKP